MTKYVPQVNDYVKWTTQLGMVHQGWVYYVASPIEPKKGWKTPSRYITIEIATKPRKQCDLTTFLHKRIHVCLCCYEQDWGELEFIRRRVSKQDDTDPDTPMSYGEFKREQRNEQAK
jgi:hypothetical protein